MIKHVILVAFFLLPQGIAAQTVIETLPNGSGISGGILTLPNDSDASGGPNNLPEVPELPIMPPANRTKNDDFQMPSYGIGVFDENGELLDLFGPGTPYTLNGNTIEIPNYELPKGARLETLSSGKATAVIQASVADVTKTAIEATTNAISDGTNYLAKRLCKDDARPTRITINLNISAAVGEYLKSESASEVEWNLAELCERHEP